VNLSCPRCGKSLAASDMNVATDVAACRQCDGVFKVSELMNQEAAVHEPLRKPSGAWLEERDDGFRAGASTRSALALMLVPFMMVWSGVSLGGLYGSQIASGHFSLGQSLFGLPFLFGTIGLGTVAVMSIAGKCELTVRGDDAFLFVGVGPIGWSRRFRWSEIHAVNETPAGRKQTPSLALEGSQRVQFGSGLNDVRRYWLLQTLRSKIAHARPVEPVPFR
jgi:hypothetical protein